MGVRKIEGNLTLPERIVFFNVNGSGMGHLNRCLAYARRLQAQATPVFFSLASAMEIIEEMGFCGDYFVSHYWSADSTFSWNSELAVRFAMFLERVRPRVVVFDGTWPFQGFMAACRAYGVSSLVWSNRGLLKSDLAQVNVDEAAFDLVVQPGEPGQIIETTDIQSGGRRLLVPPVCLLDEDELLTRTQAREQLGLPSDQACVLFSLGPGNLKDVSGIGFGLIDLFEKHGFQVLWARPPISVQDAVLPDTVRPLSLYPLARYLRAFDVFVGAAGYNTCCELMQARIPSLLVPNEHLADDQQKRAQHMATCMPVVVSACANKEMQQQAVEQILMYARSNQGAVYPETAMNGADLAARAILRLC